MFKTSLIIAGSLLLSTASISQAEVISIADPRFEVANSVEGVTRPTRGMSMANVEREFGQAEQTSSAVGEPPIIRWDYPTFIVYFEHNTVIHSVVPH